MRGLPIGKLSLSHFGDKIGNPFPNVHLPLVGVTIVDDVQNLLDCNQSILNAKADNIAGYDESEASML